MAQPHPKFHELLRETRLTAKQTPKVLAAMLSLNEEEYLAIERGETSPDDETLRRMCMIMQWNYYEAQRMIINQSAFAPSAAFQKEALPHAPHNNKAPAANSAAVALGGTRPPAREESLGKRLREVRERTGQATEIIAMLLNLNEEGYQRLEQGEMPTDDVLRRISVAYGWNYQDLLMLLRTQQASTLQPHRPQAPFSGRSPLQARFLEAIRALESHFTRLPEKDQRYVLAQIELIRDTVARQVAS